VAAMERYIFGVTSKLIKRVSQHKEKLIDGFSRNHNVDQLVWYEILETMESAIMREKQMKEWQRSWKLKRIEAMNPEWKDLYASILE
jgi:putative endonuclease